MEVSELHGSRPQLPATLSVTEAAGIARISRRHAYKLVNDGTIPSIRLGGAIRVPTHKFLELLEMGGGPERTP
jgi:excisionase family DNA binding protein